MLSSRMLDLASLELLLAVATEGSLGRAAATRGISQPAVSARIQRMEATVGFQLVERTPQGSSLTRAGSLLADWAREVLLAAAVLDAGIDSLRGSRDVRLRVAASLTIAEHMLPQWLVQLAAQHPQTAVSLAAANSADVARSVIAGDADLGFLEGPSVPRGLRSQRIGRDRLIVVAPPGHPWTRRRSPLPAAELVATRLVHREPASGTRTSLEAALAEYGPLAAPLLELSSTTAVRAAVIAGAGPAVLSALAVRDDIAAARLHDVAVAGVDLHRRLRAVWKTEQRPTGPARDLLLIAATRTAREHN